MDTILNPGVKHKKQELYVQYGSMSLITWHKILLTSPMGSFVHLLSTLITYYVSGTFLSTQDMTIKKKKPFTLRELISS